MKISKASSPVKRGMPLLKWCRREAKRLRIAVKSVYGRVRNGFYPDMKVERIHARKVMVLAAGGSRKPLSRRESARMRGKKGPNVHQHPPANDPLAKYQAWMSVDDCGGRTMPVTGSC